MTVEMTISEALDPENILPADRANAALDLLRISYADLLLKHDMLCQKHEILQKAAVRLLDVLAAKEKGGRHEYQCQ